MNYIILDWTVSDICRRKEKFCFFVFLTLWDKEISRQIGRFDSVEQAEDAKADCDRRTAAEKFLQFMGILV